MKTYSCKRKQRALILVSTGLVLGATSLLAGDASSGGFYMSTDAGVNLMDNLVVPGVGSISASPGLRWDLSMGYAFKLSDHFTLAPELETGILYNSLDTASSGGVSGQVGGDYLQVPLLANAVLNWRFSPNWVAYAGAGGGFDVQSLDDSSGDSLGSETDGAWQLMAGLKYKLGESSELGLGYKYLSVTPSGVQTVGNSAILASYTFHF